MGPSRLPLLLLAGARPAAAPAVAGTAGTTSSAGTTAEAAETANPDGATEAYPAPCKVTWSDGRVLTFKHREGGGSITSDGNGDGSRDDCGTFKTRDGKVTYLRIDEGCDRSTDATVRIRDARKIPGLLEAKVTRAGKARTMTLVPLPSFGNLLPGYLLDAAPRTVEVERNGGRITRVQAAVSGRSHVLTLGYGEDGRLSSVDEDSDGDGTPDAHFQFNRDGAGNVTRVEAQAGGRTLTGKLDYSCWATAAP